MTLEKNVFVANLIRNIKARKQDCNTALNSTPNFTLYAQKFVDPAFHGLALAHKSFKNLNATAAVIFYVIFLQLYVNFVLFCYILKLPPNPKLGPLTLWNLDRHHFSCAPFRCLSQIFKPVNAEKIILISSVKPGENSNEQFGKKCSANSRKLVDLENY